MEKVKKITLEDLIVKEKKKVLYNSKELGGSIEIVQASILETTEIIDKAGATATDNYLMSLKLILKHCPIFKSAELQERLGVGEPWEVIPIALHENMGEIGEIVEIIMDLYNFSDEAKQQEIDDLKN